jgi:hypothetical protein
MNGCVIHHAIASKKWQHIDKKHQSKKPTHQRSQYQNKGDIKSRKILGHLPVWWSCSWICLGWANMREIKLAFWINLAANQLSFS